MAVDPTTPTIESNMPGPEAKQIPSADETLLSLAEPYAQKLLEALKEEHANEALSGQQVGQIMSQYRKALNADDNHTANRATQALEASINDIFHGAPDSQDRLRAIINGGLNIMGLNIQIAGPETPQEKERREAKQRTEHARFHELIQDIQFTAAAAQKMAKQSFGSLFKHMGGDENAHDAYKKILEMTAEEYLAWYKEHDGATLVVLVEKYKEEFPGHGLTNAEIELEIAKIALEQAQQEARIELSKLDQRIESDRSGSLDFGVHLASKIFADHIVSLDEITEMQNLIEASLQKETDAFEALKVELVELERLTQDVINKGGTPSEASQTRITELKNGIIAQEHMTNAKVRFYAILDESKPGTTPLDLMKAIARAELDKDYSPNASKDPSSATIMESFQYVHGKDWVEHFTQYATEFGLTQNQIEQFLGVQKELFDAAQSLKEQRADFDNPASPLLQIGDPAVYIFKDNNGNFQTAGVDFVESLTPASPEQTAEISKVLQNDPSTRIGTLEEAKKYTDKGEALSNVQIKKDVVALADTEYLASEALKAPDPAPDHNQAKITEHKGEIIDNIIRSGGLVTTAQIKEIAEQHGISGAHSINILTATLAQTNGITVTQSPDTPVLETNRRFGVLATMPHSNDGITPNFGPAANPGDMYVDEPEPDPVAANKPEAPTVLAKAPNFDPKAPLPAVPGSL